MGSLPRLLIYLAWMWSLLHTLSGTPFASFFWVPSCLMRLPYSQTSLYLSFPHHFSALLLSRNIVRLFFACLLLSRCAYRGICDHSWCYDIQTKFPSRIPHNTPPLQLNTEH